MIGSPRGVRRHTGRLRDEQRTAFREFDTYFRDVECHDMNLDDFAARQERWLYMHDDDEVRRKAFDFDRDVYMDVKRRCLQNVANGDFSGEAIAGALGFWVGSMLANRDFRNGQISGAVHALTGNLILSDDRKHDYSRRSVADGERGLMNRLYDAMGKRRENGKLTVIGAARMKGRIDNEARIEGEAIERDFSHRLDELKLKRVDDLENGSGALGAIRSEEADSVFSDMRKYCRMRDTMLSGVCYEDGAASNTKRFGLRYGLDGVPIRIADDPSGYLLLDNEEWSELREAVEARVIEGRECQTRFDKNARLFSEFYDELRSRDPKDRSEAEERVLRVVTEAFGGDSSHVDLDRAGQLDALRAALSSVQSNDVAIVNMRMALDGAAANAASRDQVVADARRLLTIGESRAFNSQTFGRGSLENLEAVLDCVDEDREDYTSTLCREFGFASGAEGAVTDADREGFRQARRGWVIACGRHAEIDDADTAVVNICESLEASFDALEEELGRAASDENYEVATALREDGVGICFDMESVIGAENMSMLQRLYGDDSASGDSASFQQLRDSLDDLAAVGVQRSGLYDDTERQLGALNGRYDRAIDQFWRRCEVEGLSRDEVNAVYLNTYVQRSFYDCSVLCDIEQMTPHHEEGVTPSLHRMTESTRDGYREFSGAIADDDGNVQVAPELRPSFFTTAMDCTDEGRDDEMAHVLVRFANDVNHAMRSGDASEEYVRREELTSTLMADVVAYWNEMREWSGSRSRDARNVPVPSDMLQKYGNKSTALAELVSLARRDAMCSHREEGMSCESFSASVMRKAYAELSSSTRPKDFDWFKSSVDSMASGTMRGDVGHLGESRRNDSRLERLANAVRPSRSVDSEMSR